MGSHSHIILTGLPGHGKTSYIRLLAKTMKAHFIQRIGNSITIETLPEILKEINASTEPVIFFVDEIDTMTKEMIKMMNPIVEEFMISGHQINPFIFACATINTDKMKQNNPDFLNRLKFEIKFVSYELPELVKIGRQVQQQLYKDVSISDEDLNQLALNCRYNPRRIINLLEYLVIDKNIAHVLKINEIVRNGLTLTDIKILEYLATNSRPVGSNSIAMKCDMRQKQYETEFEPFLFKEGYLNKVPSRIITDKGRELLESVHDKHE
jgi:Holliday junction resolvasome RuvABC ATP-dependent DNA helicase subunit